jgi:hypothetical protein
LFFYPPQILIILEEVEQLALGGVVRSTHNTTHRNGTLDILNLTLSVPRNKGNFYLTVDYK